MQYVSDRWGNSSRIAMWELYNELLNCGGTNAPAAEAWVAEMGQALRNYEKNKYGKAHPIIVSTVGNAGLHAEKAVTQAYRRYLAGEIAHASLKPMLQDERTRLERFLRWGSASTAPKAAALCHDVLKR